MTTRIGRDRAAPTASVPSADRTLRSIRVADRAAEIIITVGGLSVIAAVLGIIFYLGSVTLPLLAPGSAGVELSSAANRSEPLDVLVDEYQTFAVVLSSAGTFDVVDLATGELVESRPVADGTAALTAGRFDPPSGRFVAGAPGRVLIGSVGFRVEVLSPADVPETASEIELGSRVRDGSAVIERIGRDQWRRIAFVSEAEQEGQVPGIPVFVDHAPARRGTVTAAWFADGTGAVAVHGRGRGTMLGEDADASLDWTMLPERSGDAEVVGIHLIDDASGLVVIGQDGLVDRTRIGRRGVTLEDAEQITQTGDTVTATGTVLGRKTIVLGTNSGMVHTAYLASQDDEDDVFIAVHRRDLFDDSVSVIRPGLRDRTVFIGSDDGSLTAWHATSGKSVIALSLPGSEPVAAIGIAPKLDGVVALTDGTLHKLSLDVGHPEATVSSLFLPVLYEGQSEPEYVYQASAAEDDAEPKLSLTPLIFGTIKATFISMLFAAPLAVLAAIFTSEFMEERARRYIKPGVEMMASLPSVVLGFLAAMVVAPFLRDHLMAVLLSFVTMPLAVVTVAAIWTAAADRQIRRLSASGTLLLVGVIAVAGIGMALAAAPFVERSLFQPSEAELAVLSGLVEAAEPGADGAVGVLDGWYTLREPANEQERQRLEAVAAEFASPNASLKSWLGGVIGGPEPGWFALTLPVATLLVGTLGWSAFVAVTGRRVGAFGPLLRILASLLLGGAIAWATAWLMAGVGLDLRDSLLGTFTQRNTLVIGMIMGLAIIPIIYTISDDAMRSVPVSLKAASLGAGATPWQTVVRVVLPVAASGIFSAVMIGLGRAVGETMIVLMATGNTPVMEWNIFSGLRTLSANIAVELPEADRGSTHYRLLFLCGVVLFIMTFVINTTAELVRQRFRRRNALL
ncbi:MAG: ABC transporter permease subunit [Planctomycetota bacterium]